MAESKSSKAGKVLAPAVLAAAGLAAAGYYFYGSKDAANHRKIAAKWARELHSDVRTQVNKLKKADRAAVIAVIDRAAKTAKSARELDSKELAKATKELKANWSKLVDSVTVKAAPKKKPAAKKAATKKAK